ncbi:MAG: type II toxin-antitoxin system VapC family toxin [Gammaproteobacteria bacterium]
MLIDTHILLWFQLGDTSLNTADINVIKKAHQQNTLYLSAISIWEIAMLQSHGRISLHQPIDKWIERATKGIQVIPINTEIAIESTMLPNYQHKDPANRFIISTARVLGLKLLTKDEKILAYIKQGYL